MSGNVDAQAVHASEAQGGAIDPATGTSGELPHFLLNRPSLTTGHAQTGERYAVAPDDAHKRLDRKDERSHANALADAAATEKKEQEADAARLELAHDPTVIAKSHGNEPSRGAKKDKEIFDDEEEELRKKEEAKQQSKEAHKH